MSSTMYRKVTTSSHRPLTDGATIPTDPNATVPATYHLVILVAGLPACHAEAAPYLREIDSMCL